MIIFVVGFYPPLAVFAFIVCLFAIVIRMLCARYFMSSVFDIDIPAAVFAFVGYYYYSFFICICVWLYLCLFFLYERGGVWFC